MKKLSEMTYRELAIEEIFSHLDDIIERSERMTSGNFMHNKNANKLSANIIKNRIEFLLSEPQLPYNIDDAAKEYAEKEYPDEPSCGQYGTGDYQPPVNMEYPREIVMDAFKAGAEWMHKQDSTINNE